MSRLLVLLGVSLAIRAHVLLPRQNIALVPLPVVSTSSFNWWPYPPGGVPTSTPIPAPTPTPAVALVPTLTSTSTPSVSPTSTDTLDTTTFSDTTTTSTSNSPSSSPTSAASLIQVTALTSLPPSTPSRTAHSPYKLHRAPLSSAWLILLCVLGGIALGCAVGWLGWSLWEKRKRKKAGAAGYAWAYPGEKDGAVAQTDVERGNSHAPLGLGPSPTLTVRENAPPGQRMPSTGSRTWIERAQARKRSGGQISGRGRGHVREPVGSELAESPLLGTSSESEMEVDAKPVPTSPPFLYGHDEIDDVPYETLRHKSIRRRIWERLGFGDEDIVRSKSRSKDADGRNTWSGAKAKEEERAAKENEHGVKVGRSLSLWGRTKSQKQKGGWVERWVRDVVVEDGDAGYEAGEETPLQDAPQHLDLGSLRRVSSAGSWTSRLGRVDSDVNLAALLGFEGKPHASHSSLEDEDLLPSFSLKAVGSRSGKTERSTGTLKERPRGVTLQDPGPVSVSKAASKETVKKQLHTPKNAIPLRSSSSLKSLSSRTSFRRQGPTPPTPSIASQYSATPKTSVTTTLSRAPTRKLTRGPTRSTVTNDVRCSPTKATAPLRASRASPAATPSRAAGTPRPLPMRRPSSPLPAGPAFVTSPPLQSALCFDATPRPPRTPPRAPAGHRTQGSRLSNPHTRASPQGAPRARPSPTRPPVTPPNARARATPPRSGYRSTANTPSPRTTPTSARPRSPKERYLARQGANARVGAILSRSYSSRNFDEGPTSPTMFGAVIDEETAELSLHDSEVLAQDGDMRSQGIEQRLGY